ncbi:hypothetical protein BU26DRAFT_84769 [Trematosphaeria pertusa]|uniref:Uncharacterized protein n=1 Tax=Trematosphaeria pertusa TaxID=390896 RepID=A0A6A6I449_9PLEO|nr:uncharacterized protein BU26DRAFT_84769 [Trematosphaeria pertusa]KAF2244722.1 hypothetical protein BU26DRAFT_84769 [Trematosphaeria pertusa]
METADRPPTYTFPNGHPTSPPMTPGTRTHARYPPQTSHTSPIYKRMGLSRLAQSPPLEFIQPTGDGHQFRFTRPQSNEASSRPSTASGRAYATTPQESEDETESDEESAYEEERPARRVEHADFVLEELDSDPGYDSDLEVVRPDHFEDAKSDKSGARLEENGFLDRFNQLRCQEGSSDEEERQRRYERKKKRWSAGIYKRSHSQSIEGDSSYSDNDPHDDVDSNARRLRRRVRGPGDRSSLVFEDRGYSNAEHIVEVEEPEDGGIPHSPGPPSIPSDDGFTLDELPFWSVVDSGMDIEVVST